jgi:glycosyltransferase involved in cell wall biosynthesis
MQVSIYMPTRNRVDLLRRAAESALGQTYASIELIVVDDASSDGTRRYLESLRATDVRVKPLYNETPVGASRARNQAITAARGEFVTGLDDDDYFHPRRVEILLTHWHRLQQSQQRLSCLFTQDTMVRGVKSWRSRKPVAVSADDLCFYNLIGNQIFTRRAYLVEAGLYDEHMQAWQDLDVFIRVLQNFGPALLVDEALYTLSLDPRPDRISMGAKPRILSAYRRICSKYVHLSPKMRQGLFLQVFGQLYGFNLDYRDLKEFFSYGVHARTLKSFLRLFVRQASGLNRLAR